MANNLFISYDLNSPGQYYEKVFDAIKALGNYAKIQKSFWYVNSHLTAEQAFDRVWAKMDRNDSLIVVDATNNSARWEGVPKNVSDFIISEWNK